MNLNNKETMALARLIDALNGRSIVSLNELIATRRVAKLMGDDHPITILENAILNEVPQAKKPTKQTLRPKGISSAEAFKDPK
jgi:hypothetical protein